MSRVVVIGAGLSGLAAACQLAGAGHDVTVVERDDQVGGVAGQLKADGFTFDLGPTVMTAPSLLYDAIRAAGSDPADVIELHKVDPGYRALYADGSTIAVRSGIEALTAEIEAACGAHDAAAVAGFVDWLRQLWEVELPHFIDADFDHPFDLLRHPGALLRLVRLGGFGRLGPAVGRFFDDPRLRRLFSFQAMYAGLAPDRALALYAVITYLDSIEGVWFPTGGMHAIPQALATAARSAGVTVRLGAPVTAILRSADGRVAGVEVGNGRGTSDRISADAVVCTVDPARAYATLLPDVREPRWPIRPRYSPSAVVWHVGVRGRVGPDVAHHNLHFGQAWAASFEEMLDQGRLMSDPSRLVTVHSLDDPSLAPPDSSTLYVLEPVPNLSGRIDWRTERGPIRERLHSFLSEHGYPSDVVAEHLVTPPDWLDRGLPAGTPFSLSHTFLQTGPFRPKATDRRVPGLFFAGAGTVPGVGVPMVLISGRLAARRADRFLGGAGQVVSSGDHARR